MNFFKSFFAIFFMFTVAGCNNDTTETIVTTERDSVTTTTTMLPSAAGFQQTIDNKKTDLYILKNSNGMQAAVTNFGGRLVSLLVPDKDGKLTDVVIGFDSVLQYRPALSLILELLSAGMATGLPKENLH